MQKSQESRGTSVFGGMSRRTILRAGGALSLATISLGKVARAGALRPMVYAYAGWPDAVAFTHVGAQLIEEHFGYKVRLLEAVPGAIYEGLKSGNADVYSVAYMEGLGPLKGHYHGGQADYVRRVAKSIEVIGVSEGPMTQGLAVPDYVSIDSIAELNENAGKFGDRIIGIDAGSGLMRAAAKTVKAYGLKLRLVDGSTAAMQAAFARAYSHKEWIVVTSWKPLPMWVKFKMRYLDDPKKTMMAEPFYCFTVVRNNFEVDFPKAYEFFKKFHIPNDDLAEIMSWIKGGMAPKDAAAKWIDANRNRGVIDKWIAS